MTDPLTAFGPRVPTPQSEPVLPGQVQNNAGGFVFEIDPLTRATRFLILGTTGGTYYATEQDHTEQAASFIIGLANDEVLAPQLLRLVREVSLSGRAPKQNPTLFTLAALCSSKIDAVRVEALAIVPAVCRTGTMLFQYTTYLRQFRGIGRGVRRAIGSWYLDKPIEQLTYQAIKYRQRGGWTHRDLLRLSHPATDDPRRQTVFDWICGRGQEGEGLLDAYWQVNNTSDPEKVANLILQYNLPWEVLPDNMLRQKAVWEAMLPGMGLTALIRNLGRLTELGVVAPMSKQSGAVATRLLDEDQIRRARIHPFTILNAGATYNAGHGYKGNLSWTPIPEIVRALGKAFYLAFGNIQPANKRTLVAIDVSPSMDGSRLYNSALTAREAAAAMAMTVVRTEERYMTCAFAGGFVQCTLTPDTELRHAMDEVRGKWSQTDCAVPMIWALQHTIPVDTFIIYTDNETWSGRIHPFQALAEYRDKMGLDDARLVVVGLTATKFSIANPDDRGMLDVVGFDTASPNIITDFSRGDI